MGLRRHPLAAAAILSLLLHLSLLQSMGRLWPSADEEIPFPIEARLELPLPPEPAPPPPSPTALPPRPQTPPQAMVREPPTPPAEPTAPPAEPEGIPLAQVQGDPAMASSADQQPLPRTEGEPEQASIAHQPAVSAAPPLPLRPALRELPEHLVFHYAVLAGENGFVAGRASYAWRSRDGRYSLVSVAEATGLTAMFISGRIIQVSQGMVAAEGLKPEQYWLQKGQRRKDGALFDWRNRRLVMSRRDSGEALPDHAQDLLSFPFHLALTAGADEADFTLPITNGKRLREYRFRALGTDTLLLGGRQIDTLHLQGGRQGEEGLLDVWLAPELSGLPVKIRTLDDSGRAITLLAEGLPKTEQP